MGTSPAWRGVKYELVVILSEFSKSIVSEIYCAIYFVDTKSQRKISEESAAEFAER